MNAAGASDGGWRSLPVTTWRGEQPTRTVDAVACEVPIALEFNGIAHAVMLASPTDLPDFALGFSLSEGVLDSPDDLLEIDADESAEGITLRLRIGGAAFHRLKVRRRSLAGRTGCGLCGVEALSQVVRDIPPLPRSGARFEPAAVGAAFAALRSRQRLHDATGAVHAAAWASADGTIELIREDVGRHNALDKLIGALARQDGPAPARDAAAGVGGSSGAGFIAVSSRASVEMVQKAVIAGAPLLAAASAATTLAVDVARASRLTLVGFVRSDRLTVYSHPARLSPRDAAPAGTATETKRETSSCAPSP